MSEYIPDDWTIVKINSDQPHYRVLCSWAGSYLYGASWKLSSGILSVEETDTHYIMPQHSGSTYKLHKNGERMSGIMSDIWTSFSQQQTTEVSIEIVPIEKFLEDWVDNNPS
jgi:hypothetical protein